jgi:putative peptidoglycan lipid II flippase
MKTVIIARAFGAGDAVDAYLMAFLIPSFAGDVLAGAIAPSLLPMLVEVKERQGSRQARELAGSVMTAATALLVVVALVAAALSGPVLHFFASGFPAAKLKATQELLFWMLPILPLSAVTATFRTVLNAEQRFAVPALAPVATPVAIVACVYTLHGSRALAAGTLLGALIEVALLAAALGRIGFLLVPRLHWPTDVGRVFSEYAPVAASYLVLGGSSIVDQALAATLGSGSVSALNYGTRLVAVVVSIGSSSLGTAILPRFSKLAAAGRWNDLKSAFRSLAGVSLAVMVPLTLLLALFSQPLVRLLFQRGAFNVAASQLVNRVQLFSLLQIPFSVLLVLAIRMVWSLKVNRLLFRLAVFSLIANVVFDLALMKWLGVAGIALSTTLVHACGLAFLGWTLFRAKPWSVLPLQPAMGLSS